MQLLQITNYIFLTQLECSQADVFADEPEIESEDDNPNGELSYSPKHDENIAVTQENELLEEYEVFKNCFMIK